MKLVLATHNNHKVQEITAVLSGMPIQVVGLDELPGVPNDIPETMDTFEGNALQKARFVFERTGLVCVADDSGLVVDSLMGEPGVSSKRWTPEATAKSNNRRLLMELAGVTDRTARFICAMAVVTADSQRVVIGSCEGHIAKTPRGRGGFGYDPLFIPDQTPERTMAELSAEQKNQISHRGQAFGQLTSVLNELGLA